MKQINEMAFNRADILANITTKGRQFIQHFDKIYNDFLNDKWDDFKHHSQEMQTWWDDVKKLRFKGNHKLISNTLLYDGFFTAGSIPEDYLHNDKVEVEAYESLVKILLENRDTKVYSVLKEIFNLKF